MVARGMYGQDDVSSSAGSSGMVGDPSSEEAAYDSMPSFNRDDGVPPAAECGMAPEALNTGWDCHGAGCVPSTSSCPQFRSVGDCMNRGCGRMRYRCMAGPGNSTRLVPDPKGEYYSKEQGIREGCGQECTPSNFLGSYVGSEVYYPNCSTSTCNGPNEGGCNVLTTVNQATVGSCNGYGMSMNTGKDYAGCNVLGEPLGPCVRGLDSNVLIAADTQSGCAGFDEILIDRPRDMLWANTLGGGDPTVLTNTRNQSFDLRGDIAVGAVDGCCDGGNAKPGTGPFCGTQLPQFGPFESSGKAVREFVY